MLPSIHIHANTPRTQMRFTTAGDWTQQDGVYEIWICETADWRMQAIVLFHELIELLWCHKNGVTAKDADIFDAKWEAELEKGIHKPWEEAGFAADCPYGPGHRLGVKAEKLGCFALGMKWGTYVKFWDHYFGKP